MMFRTRYCTKQCTDCSLDSFVLPGQPVSSRAPRVSLSKLQPRKDFKSQTLHAYHKKCKEDKAEQTDSSSEDDEDEQAPSKQSKKGKRSSRQQALANLSCTSQTGGQRQGPIEDTPRMNGSHQEPIRESKHHATYGSQDHRIPPHKSGHEQPGSIHKGTRFLG